MKFSTAPANRPTRLVATLVILSFGVGMIVCTPMPGGIAGVALTAVGGCLLCSQLWAIAREKWSRRDRYDLTLLDNTSGYTGPSRDNPAAPREDPDWESEAEDTVYCHRCDISMPNNYAICPQCGSRVG